MCRTWKRCRVNLGPVLVALLSIALSAVAVSAEPQGRLDAESLLEAVLDSDPWGLDGADVEARAIVTAGAKPRELQFRAQSRRHEPPLAMGLIRFAEPADVAGTKFLQIQRKRGNDERYLYAPPAKQARLLAAKVRSQAFLGTDYSYADMDGRDLRDSKRRLLEDAKVATFDCYRLEVVPNDTGSAYGRLEVAVRKDNRVAIQWLMFDHANKLIKTLRVREIRTIGERTFVTRSIMKTHDKSTSTELVLDNVVPRDDIPFETFSLRELAND